MFQQLDEEKRALIHAEYEAVRDFGNRYLTSDEFENIAYRVWNLTGIKLDFLRSINEKT